MELYLQFGYGMMEHCRHLVEHWNGGTAVLSPRDLKEDQISRLGPEIVERTGRTLVDPQFYDPHANHHRLVEHEYWPDDFDTSMLSGGAPLTQLLQRLLDLNTAAGADRFIVPGLYSQRVDDDWLAVQETVIGESAQVVGEMPRLATVCLSGEALRFEDQVEIVTNAAENWEVDGIYLVPEHPGAQYLVDDPMWLGNLLVLCAGLKLQGKSVVVGYCSHQMLCLAAAGVDAIASGTWLNVRSFTPDKFQEIEPEDVSRRSKWYYCPQALSEFKIPFLDMAHRFGVLDSLRPENTLLSDYADVLFAGAQPTSTEFSEQQAHRHYLQCLRMQCAQAKGSGYRETFDAHMAMLDSVESRLEGLHRLGVRGQDRDFGNMVDVNRSAMAALEHARGFVLERTWQ